MGESFAGKQVKYGADERTRTADLPIAALNAKRLLNQAVSQFEDRQEMALLGAVVMKDVMKFSFRRDAHD
jgi:hypothetical protein